jgi:hypothetical protein
LSGNGTRTRNHIRDTLVPVNKLEFWSAGLLRLARQQTDQRLALADRGVLARGAVPSVVREDGPAVTRIKEELLALNREETRIHEEMSKWGVTLLDAKTMEFIMPGGPEPGSVLSWTPGERALVWWRKTGDVATTRQRLADPVANAEEPLRH